MPLTFGPPSTGWPDFGGRPSKSTYVAGPMRGIERFNFPAFDDAEKHLTAEGWVVFSPAQMDREKYGDGVEFGEVVIDAAFMHDCMKRDIATLLVVDAIHLLEGWEDSKGVATELAVARAIGLEVYEQVDSGWVRRA